MGSYRQSMRMSPHPMRPLPTPKQPAATWSSFTPLRKTALSNCTLSGVGRLAMRGWAGMA